MFACGIDHDRWQGSPPWPAGQYCGQAAAQWPEDCRRAMRGLNISGEFFRAKRTFYTYFQKFDGIGGAEVKIAVDGSQAIIGRRLTRLLFTVKYHAYLRKMTRYNPTRGGKDSSSSYEGNFCHFDMISDSHLQVLSISVPLQESSIRPSVE
jgi:hypothetical protein